MATNLNPGADATLVSVAYRAAMADTPGDYSDTLEKAAEGYSKTMEASSEMWGNVAKVGAKLGGEMVKNANERAAMAAKANTLNPEDAEFLLNGLYENKDAQRELGLLPGVFGSRETKKDLAILKMDQQKIFAEIDSAAASLKAGTDAVASGAFDTKLAMNDGEMVNAIIKSGLKNRVTDNGNIAKLGRDEYGELAYTLYKENGELADNPNGTSDPATMSIKQFNEAIATNVDDKGAKAAGFEKKNTQVANRGLKSRTGVYDEQMKAMDSNWIDTQIEEPIDLKRAMHMKFGYMDTSFFDDLTKNQNVYSADLYKTLLEVTGGDNALTGVITDGIEDVGEPGINEVELKNSENYQVLTANLLGMKDPEVTKAYFKDYVLKEFEGANNYGHGNKTPVAGKTGKTETNPYGILLNKKGEYNLGFASKGTNYIQGYDPGYVTRKIDYLKNGTPIDFQGINYTFRTVDGKSQWYENYGYKEGGGKTEGVGIGRVIGSAEDMARDVFSVDDPIFTSIVTEKEPERIDDKTGLTSGDNPFSDAGTGEVAVVPDKFIKAVGNDDKKVVEYLKTMKVPGLKIKGAGYGADNIVLEINDKKKVFIVDPNWEDDDVRATEIWQWLYSNWSASENSGSNDEYYNLITESE